MSSVTFLASAVLTVCVLHAVDQNMADAVNKIGLDIDKNIEVNQPDNVKFEQLIKPADAKIFTPNAQVFSPKKTESSLTNTEQEKRIVAKNTSAI